ncbi:Pseudouridine-5'-phosphatase [Tritrichomonas musculus]|uniref:Pseudouridine-5'-phosphatase n=1 Tax=Tritrichomonas musculus TaxID=1915356 RepID=A0ABR2L1P1_9EUKA
MTIWPHPIRACIFDNDNTLVDTDGAYEEAHYITTGHKQTLDLKLKLSGVTLLEGSSIVINEYHLDETPMHYAKRFEDTLQKLLCNTKLMPGVFELLHELKRLNIKMCIATAASSSSFEKKISNHHDLMEMMDHYITGDLVKHGKPAPDIFLMALDKWNHEKVPVKNDEALVFEDSPLGVKAANNAGMPVVFIPNPLVDVEKVLAEYEIHPTLTIKSLKDFDFSKFIWEGDENVIKEKK